MKVLVIGGAGFLGANLVRRCLDARDDVTVLDSLDPALRASTENLRAVWSRVNFIRGDMGSDATIGHAVQGQHVIFQCAAQTSHPLSQQDPVHDAEVNCIGNLKVLDAVRQLNPEATVVYTSSSTVVGRAVGETVDERHGEAPLDIYSANKGAAEKYYRIFNRVHDLKTVVLRFANLFGPYGKGYPEFGFVNYFIALAREGKAVTVFGDGEQTRNVLYVEDATEILYRAATDARLIGGVYFAAHEEHLPVLDIARGIVETFGGELRRVPWPDERKRIDVDSVRISSAALREITGWRPGYSFADGLVRTREILGGVTQGAA